MKELSKDGKRKDQWKDRRTGGEGRIKGRIDAQGVKGIWHDISNFRIHVNPYGIDIATDRYFRLL